MASHTSRDRSVAIVGYGVTPMVRRSIEAPGTLAARAVRSAALDAGVAPRELDGFVTAGGAAGSNGPRDGIRPGGPDGLAARVGGRPVYTETVEATTQLAGALGSAIDAIVSGAAETVVVYRAFHHPRAEHPTGPAGGPNPVAAIAATYREYVQRHGVDADALLPVALEARANGARVPWSYWRDQPLSEPAYRAEPLVCAPIRRGDCDRPVDGAAAVVLASARRASDLPHRPVYVNGYALSAPRERRRPLSWPLEDLRNSGAELARRAWSVTGFDRSGVDVAQVYDGFAPFVYLWLEALGYCPEGEAHEFAADGGIDATRPTGVPVLSGGGSLGTGRLHGMAQLLECYLQLAGRAGDRQRERASTALLCHGPPHTGGVFGLLRG